MYIIYKNYSSYLTENTICFHELRQPCEIYRLYSSADGDNKWHL